MIFPRWFIGIKQNRIILISLCPDRDFFGKHLKSDAKRGRKFNEEGYQKGLSCLIAGLMAFSGISGALAANEGGASDAGNENVIDLSHDSPAGSGLPSALK